MLKNNLVLDCGSETTDLLKSWAAETFYDFSKLDHRKDRIYVVGRTEFSRHRNLIRDLVNQGIHIVFSNPFEGSETLRMQIEGAQMADLFFSKKILLIGGGDMSKEWPCLVHDHFLGKIHDFEENNEAIKDSDLIYSTLDKPYTFLFLNARGRSHRKWMIEYLDYLGILQSSLYTWLDPSSLARRDLHLIIDGENLMARPRDLHFLPEQYEVPRYRDRLSVPSKTVFAKYDLFNSEWGEIYIHPEQYINTYFSLVTETVHTYPYSFRTEKIWKPISMAHPWICVANRGFYRDMRNLGFQTFDKLINEDFDMIDDNQQRLEKVSQIVKEICEQGPSAFLSAAKDICKYNQQHMLAIREPIQKTFPERFFQFLRDYQWMI